MFTHRHDEDLPFHNLIKTGGTNQDAIDGFAKFAQGLDSCGVALDHPRGSGFGDMLTICVSWAILALVIFYPGTQIAAIGAGIAFFAFKSLLRALIGGSRQLSTRIQSSDYYYSGMRPITN